MTASKIVVRGARTHNLRNVDLDLPRDALVVITGPSGSGKSSLAFDTIFAEGQRRYVESLSVAARQVLSQLPKPDVDLIEACALLSVAAEQGLAPARENRALLCDGLDAGALAAVDARAARYRRSAGEAAAPGDPVAQLSARD